MRLRERFVYLCGIYVERDVVYAFVLFCKQSARWGVEATRLSKCDDDLPMTICQS